MALPTNIANNIQGQAQTVLEKGSKFQSFDQVRQRHFWSTYRFVPDSDGFVKSGDFDVFQTPQGQQGQGFVRALTLQETNWPSSNRVPDNQNFVITEFGCRAAMVLLNGLGADAAEVDNRNVWNAAGAAAILLDNTVLSVTYLTNTVPMGLCTDFCQAAGPSVGFYSPGVPQDYSASGPGGAGSGYLPGVDPNAGTGPAVYNNAPTDQNRLFYTNGFASPALRRHFKIPILLQHGETFRLTLSVLPGRGPFIMPWSAELPTETAPYGSWCLDLRVDFFATESFVENA